MRARLIVAIACALGTAAIGTSACVGEQVRTVDAGYDPATGNPFSGPLALDDLRVRDLAPDALPAVPGACRPPQLAIVVEISDGDTLRTVLASDGTELRVRMIGIDTPEVAHPDAGPADCYGPEAAAFSELLRGRHVWLTFDAGCLDPFDRSLAYVWVGAGPGDLWQRQLLRRGLATVLSIAPNTAMASTFQEDEDAARAAGAGLWSACP